MAVLFQVLRGTFYFFTFIMGAFLLRGDLIFGEQLFPTIKLVFMPGYLLFCGIMVGYLIALIWSGKDITAVAYEVKENILKKSFIIGILVGCALALSYIFMLGESFI